MVTSDQFFMSHLNEILTALSVLNKRDKFDLIYKKDKAIKKWKLQNGATNEDFDSNIALRRQSKIFNHDLDIILANYENIIFKDIGSITELIAINILEAAAKKDEVMLYRASNELSLLQKNETIEIAYKLIKIHEDATSSESLYPLYEAGKKYQSLKSNEKRHIVNHRAKSIAINMVEEKWPVDPKGNPKKPDDVIDLIQVCLYEAMSEKEYAYSTVLKWIKDYAPEGLIKPGRRKTT